MALTKYLAIVSGLIRLYIHAYSKYTKLMAHVYATYQKACGLEVFENCMLNEHFTHNKGNQVQKKQEVPPDIVGPKRYKQLADIFAFMQKAVIHLPL